MWPPGLCIINTAMCSSRTRHLREAPHNTEPILNQKFYNQGLPPRFGPNYHRLVKLMINTQFVLVSGPFWPKMPLLGASEVPPSDQIWSQMSPGPNSRGSIGTSDNFYVLKTTGPEAVLLYCLVLHVIELYSVVLYGIAYYFIVFVRIVWYCMLFQCIAW